MTHEKAEEIVRLLLEDLSDREGFELDLVDSETRDEWKQLWIRIVMGDHTAGASREALS